MLSSSFPSRVYTPNTILAAPQNCYFSNDVKSWISNFLSRQKIVLRVNQVPFNSTHVSYEKLFANFGHLIEKLYASAAAVPTEYTRRRRKNDHQIFRLEESSSYSVVATCVVESFSCLSIPLKRLS